jgi:hypothetical protein
MTGVQMILAFLAVALPFLLWLWRRRGVKWPTVTYDSSGRDEPCWTEEVSSDGRYSYGRYGCYHGELKEMEVRARLGEFNTPA